MQPFRIYAGWDSRQAEAAEVFAYSVLANASIPVDIEFLKIKELPITRTGTTDFTFSRFLSAWCADFEGVALFADCCDQLCVGDVAELAAIDMGDYAVRVVKHKVNGQKRPRSWSSVMLLNCERFGDWTPGYIETAPDAQLMRFASFPDEAIGDLPWEWNTMVAPGDEPPPGAKLAHYSALANPNGGSWVDRSRSKVWAEWRQRWHVSA